MTILPFEVEPASIAYNISKHQFFMDDGYISNEYDNDICFYPFPEDITYNGITYKKDTRKGFIEENLNNRFQRDDYIIIKDNYNVSRKTLQAYRSFEKKNQPKVVRYNKSNYHDFLAAREFVKNQWKKNVNRVSDVGYTENLASTIYNHYLEKDVFAYIYYVKDIPVFFELDVLFNCVMIGLEGKSIKKFEDLNLHGLDEYTYYYPTTHMNAQYYNMGYTGYNKPLADFKNKFSNFTHAYSVTLIGKRKLHKIDIKYQKSKKVLHKSGTARKLNLLGD